MDKSIRERVDLLKKANCVSSKKLIDIKYSDKVVQTQIEVLEGIQFRTQDELNYHYIVVYNEAKKMSEGEARGFIRKSILDFINLPDMPHKHYDPEFWRNFGSAAFKTSEKNPIGMDMIWEGNQFENCYSMMYKSLNAVNQISKSYEDYLIIIAATDNSKSSNYESLNDLESNIPVKKIKLESEIFYKDKSKEFNDRLDVFNKYANHEDWIHHPSNILLSAIFDIAMEYDEGMMIERHQTVETSEVVNWWIENLEYNRCKISYNKNEYHPEIIKSERNYKPSKAAIERLKKYYIELLMIEGVTSFIHDW